MKYRNPYLLGSEDGSPYLLWSSALLIVLGTLYIVPHGNFINATSTVPRFWQGIGIMALGFVLSWWLRSLSVLWFWGIAVLSRLVLLLMTPGAEIWRYLWDGYIQLKDVSPYEYAPDATALIPYRTEWWDLIQQLDISTIYSPGMEFGFRTLAAIAPSVWLFKLAFVFADLLTCWLLSRRFGCVRAALYAWNPLIIYSFAGGGHFDSWFILPLVAAWLFFDTPNIQTSLSAVRQGRTAIPFSLKRAARRQPIHWFVSAIFLGIAAAINWVALPILLFLGWRSFWQRGIKYAGIVLVLGLLPLLASLFPYCSPDACSLIPAQAALINHGRSADLIPYIASLIWKPLRWVNWPYAIPLFFIVLALMWRVRTFLEFSEWYLAAVFILSPILHAWYFTWIVPFAVATGNWGTRLISISAFVYFALHLRVAQGIPEWFLPPWARVLLWLPFLLGWFWLMPRSRPQSRYS